MTVPDATDARPSTLHRSVEDLLTDWVDRVIPQLHPVETSGSVIGADGGVIHISQIDIPIGGRCRIATNEGDLHGEVVGFGSQSILVMSDRSLNGLRRGDRVIPERGTVNIEVGNTLLGRVIDAYGHPLDDRGPLHGSEPIETWPIEGIPVNPMERARLTVPLDIGVRAINGIATLGRGMRTGLFAGSGVGKSTLLGMMARNAKVDCVVLAMIGERGREVREFIEDHLGPALTRSVVVVSAADSPPLARVLGAHRAAAIAESFRAKGRHVLLLVDSLTRLAMAGREIGLSVGEPAAMRGYPPSVFSRIAGFVERAGNGNKDQGSITGLYTVLVEGDDHVADPVADTARAVLDGHIVLSRRMSEAGIYPPIDLSVSLSRPMPSLVSQEHNDAARRFRLLWARLIEKRELVDIGAYAPGRDPVLDEALRRMAAMESFLRQESSERVSLESAVAGLIRAVGGHAQTDQQPS